MAVFRRCVAILIVLLPGLMLRAQARFDLPGPKIDIRVTRDGVMLPIASVPNLQPGDQVWLHPDFPASQSAHYLLIATFLRGTTNPPPDNWFIRIETWDKKVREEGVTVTVPDEAQQAILFLAPETGGDFTTLRSAVKGRPGIFVRASQDLAEAGFEQGRIEKYLAAMKQVPPGDAKALQQHSDLLARTLALKPNPDCAKLPIDQQYNCLTQTGNQLLLDDGHATSVAAALSTGPGSDFINQASYTQLAGAGMYSAYVGAIVDLVRLTSGLHTAKYQYIPAIAFPSQETEAQSLDLRLNSPPSFNNPKSVIVIGLPAVQKAVAPPLRPVDANHISCLLEPHLALPIEGAPLVFSTAFAHDLVLHLNVPAGTPIPANQQDIPLVPDAYQGGLVFQPKAPERHELTAPASIAKPVAVPGFSTATPAAPPQTKAAAGPPGAPIAGTIEGYWGFDKFVGPTVALQAIPGKDWRIAKSPNAGSGAPDMLIVGRPNQLELVSTGTACIKSIGVEPGDAKVDWKLATVHAPADPSHPPAPAPVDLTVNLNHDDAAGAIHLAITQYGEKDPDLVSTRTFIESARIDSLKIHAGDTSAVLTGTSLYQVKDLVIKGDVYTPETGTQNPDKTLTLELAHDAKAQSLRPSDNLTAEVHLRDGRTVPISADVLPPRPAVTILSRKVTPTGPSSVALGNGDDLALGSQLVFFLKSKAPFLRTDQIEIANQTDVEQPAETLHTTLSVASGSLVLQDAHTVLATFDPLKTFGPSTFGPFHLRAIAADGTTGAWVPLATIVRLPTLAGITCPVDPAAECKLGGSALYLLDSVSLSSDFTAPTKVPEGFVDSTLAIPHPPVGVQPATLYLRLRDDPATEETATLAVETDTPIPPPARGRGSKSGSASVPTAGPAPAAATASTVGDLQKPAQPATPAAETPPANQNALPAPNQPAPGPTTPPPS